MRLALCFVVVTSKPFLDIPSRGLYINVHIRNLLRTSIAVKVLMSVGELR